MTPAVVEALAAKVNLPIDAVGPAMEKIRLRTVARKQRRDEDEANGRTRTGTLVSRPTRSLQAVDHSNDTKQRSRSGTIFKMPKESVSALNPEPHDAEC